MREDISALILESAAVKTRSANDQALIAGVESAVHRLLATIKAQGTVYMCGNGGSACDAMHFMEELVARFKRERVGIKAMHFMDPGVLTCWGNDYDFSTAFERQVRTFCGKNDLLFLISTSGNSKNILSAADAARDVGVFSVGLTGKGGGALKERCSLPLVVPAVETERIQEMHITIIHMICELAERILLNISR